MRYKRYAKTVRQQVIRKKEQKRKAELVWAIGISAIVFLVLAICSISHANKKLAATIVKAEETKDYYNVAETSISTLKSDLFVSDEDSPIEEIGTEENGNKTEITWSKDWDDSEARLLVQIAMAEAEGCSTETKAAVIMVVLNRVWSDDFPDSISEVLYQENQFSPVGTERWYLEPTQDCYDALAMVYELDYDITNGALYFESCTNGSWQENNCTFLFEMDGLRFYK